MGSYFDFYLLHRDDPSRFPDIGSIVTTMHGLVTSGKCRAWGVSNWTLPRVEAAYKFAEENGLSRPMMSSPQFSLAVPEHPVWSGCQHLTSDSATFFADKGILTAVWAPLAEGYLTGSLGRPESAGCWNTPENGSRRERVHEMAAQRAVDAASLSLAYTLEAGASAVIIGTIKENHLQDAVRATEIKLSA